MRFRLPLVVAALALIAASCGVDRSVDTATDTTPDATSATVDGQTDESAVDGGVVPTTAVPAPVTTAADDEVAVTVVYGDGTEGEILHGALNSIAVPTKANDEFVGLIYPSGLPAGFESIVLTQQVWSDALEHEVIAGGSSVTPEDEATAKSLVFDQLAGVLPPSADPASESERLYNEVPYLAFIVELQSRQLALSNLLKASAPEAEKFPCVSHILVDTEEEATQTIADLQGGADFATLARERSTDTGSGLNGGELGCVDPANYVTEFADAVSSATVGEVVGPVQSEYGFHVLVVTGVEADGDALASDSLQKGLEAATITIDDRIGTWDPSAQRITPAS